MQNDALSSKLTFISLHWYYNGITVVILILRLACGGELVNNEETKNIVENDTAILQGYLFDFYEIHYTLNKHHKNLKILLFILKMPRIFDA